MVKYIVNKLKDRLAANRQSGDCIAVEDKIISVLRYLATGTQISSARIFNKSFPIIYKQFGSSRMFGHYPSLRPLVRKNT